MQQNYLKLFGDFIGTFMSAIKRCQSFYYSRFIAC